MTHVNIHLRLEKESDYDAVERVTYRAFLSATQTNVQEALLARKLRSCTTFVPELDYVAELDGVIVGNIMYTRSKVVGDAGEWETLTFGPVSVLPQYQRQGIGGALINETLTLARKMGFRGVLIFGHADYYPRFGFADASQYGITTAEGKNFPAFMALPLYEGALSGIHGRLICDDAYFTLDKAECEALNAKLAESMGTLDSADF
jgi:predicted N-acetyltransferase YhbS